MTIVRPISFIFATYNQKKSIKIFKPKMQKIRQADADLQKSLKTKKIMLFGVQPEIMKLFWILGSDTPNIAQLAKRKLCSVTMTFEPKISRDLIRHF